MPAWPVGEDEMKVRKLSKRDRNAKRMIDRSVSFALEVLESRRMMSVVAAPTNASQISATPTSITLSWKDNSNNEDGFQVQRLIGANYVAEGNTPPNGTTYTDTGLTPATGYQYRILAFSGQDISGFAFVTNGATTAAPVTPPYAPYFLTATANSSTQISLSWFDNAGTETGVAVERKTGNGAFAGITTLAPHAQSYVDTGLTAGTTYTYRVAAVNTAGYSPYTNESAATTQGGVVPPATPAAPTLLTTSAASSTQITLNWTDNSNNETGFNVERQNGAAWSIVKTVGPNVTTYSDTGLAASTAYTYRVSAVNGAAVSGYTNTSTATTLAGTTTTNPPFAPYFLSASSDSASQISLKWFDNAGVETGVHVERQTGNGAWGVIATLAPHAQSYTDTGLTGSTLYSYRVASFNDGGNSPYTNTSSATTPAATTTTNPPYAPYYLSANADSASQVSLKWYDNAGVETGVHVERQTGNGAWGVVATLAPHAQSYTDTGLTASTLYSYRVASFNDGGNSPYTNTSSAQTPAGVTPPTVPAAPTLLITAAGSSSQITLNWTDNSSNETGFNIEKLNGATWQPLVSVGANVTTYTDGGLTANTAYSYRVAAVNGAGPSGYSNISTATTQAVVTTTQPPAAPFFLVATANSATQVTLNWFDGAGTETGVNVERQTGSGGPWSVITTLAAHAQTYIDKSAVGGTFYSYRVASTNSAGPSPYSNFSSVITPGAAQTTPASPSALTTAALSSTQIQLNWTDNSNNETGFYVEKLNGAVWQTIATLPANTTTYTDTNLTAGTQYTYRVDSFNGAGAGAPSNTSAATTLTSAAVIPGPPSNLTVSGATSSSLTLNWNDNSLTETNFNVEKIVNGNWTPLISLPANTTTYTDTGLAASTGYFYRVNASNGAGPSGYAGPSNGTTLAGIVQPTTPAAPTNLVASNVPTSNSQLSLAWTDNSNNETGFNIERLNGATWTYLTTVAPNTTSYTDNGLSASTAYSYRVVAFNGALFSGYSNTSAATTSATTTIPPRTDLSTFFPIGVFLQPAYLMPTWQSRGINTMVGHEKYGTTTLESWTATANSLGLKYFREPLANSATDIADPNLLAWLYTIDEPDLEPDVNIASSAAAAFYQQYHSIDPTRPIATTYAGGYMIGDITKLFGRPKAYYDQLVTNNTDWLLNAMYPVTGWNRPDALNWVGQTEDRSKAWYPGKRSIAYIETSNQNLPWVGAAERGPTAGEMRGEIWDAIIHGSTGIVYFPQQVYNPFAYDTTPADVVAEMVTQNARLSKYGTALLTAENPAGTSLSASGNIETAWRRYNGHTYYFALNLSPGAVTASLATTGLSPSQTVSVDGENRTVTLQNGNLTDTWGANECHVYVV
jgi:titin